MINDRRKDIDLLIEQFWRRGYLTVSRKYGTYLPEPSSIGGFEIDAVARYRKNYAIGISLTDQDFVDESFVKNKLAFLATRQTRGSNKKVNLFVAVAPENFKRLRKIVDQLDSETRKNIRICEIKAKTEEIPQRHSSQNNQVLFS